MKIGNSERSVIEKPGISPTDIITSENEIKRIYTRKTKLTYGYANTTKTFTKNVSGKRFNVFECFQKNQKRYYFWLKKY